MHIHLRCLVILWISAMLGRFGSSLRMRVRHANARCGRGCTTESMSLGSFEIPEHFLQALKRNGFPDLMEVQKKSYAAIMSGQDVIIGAETGSGKTLSYMLPLAKLAIADDSGQRAHPLAIVLTPNKELCKQVCEMGRQTLRGLEPPVSIEPIAGVGGSYTFGDSEGVPDIAVCTPKYLADIVRGPRLADPWGLIESVRHVVLDEADMLLQGSYLKDVEKVLDAFKLARRERIRKGDLKVHEKGAQFVLVAATLPSAGTRSVLSYALERFPQAVTVRTGALHAHHPAIQQEFVAVELLAAGAQGESAQRVAGDGVQTGSREHAQLVAKAIMGAGPAASLQHQVMVFLNTAEMARQLAESLRSIGLPCVEYHGLLNGREREQNMAAFRAGSQMVMVCTDSAGRGLDLPRVRHVVQAEFALNVVQHQHRVGRCSRAGRAGKATNFYGPASRLLVESIRGAAEELDMGHAGENLEGAESKERDKPVSSIERSFSRRRGFRRSVKRSAAGLSAIQSSR